VGHPYQIAMIKDRTKKLNEIIAIIKNSISDINKRYRSGPALYFYNRLYQLRNDCEGVKSFLEKEYHLEVLYATLVSWDMNSRGAKLKYFDDFKENILSCCETFQEFENKIENKNKSFESIEPVLKKLYTSLHVMKTKSKLVSNSKLLHFLFPEMLIPMDRNNTLSYFYNNSSESLNKYIEIIDFSFEIMNLFDSWETYLDSGWNKTIPKLIDNAIILLEGKSIK